MPVVFSNNAVSRLASSLSSSATALSVNAGEGVKFPSPTAGSWFPLTLVKASGAIEIVRCTARSGDVFTVVRAQEGTSSQSFSSGDRAELRLTSAAIAEIQNDLADIISKAALKANNLSDLTDKTAARNNLQLGTSALKNTQTSPYDQAVGSTLILGAFGLGVANSLEIGDCNSIRISGFFNAGPTSTNKPPPLAAYGTTLFVHCYSETAVYQLASAPITSSTGQHRTFERWLYNGAFTPWEEVYTSGAITALAKSLLAATTQAGFRSLIGAPGGVDKQMCTAWVSFNGTGTVSILDSHNVSSVADNGVGDYTINFATSMSNANFEVSASCKTNSFANIATAYEDVGVSRTTSAIKIRTATSSAASSAFFDPEVVCASFHGGK